MHGLSAAAQIVGCGEPSERHHQPLQTKDYLDKLIASHAVALNVVLVTNNPLRLSATPVQYRWAPLRLGADTRCVLRD